MGIARILWPFSAILYDFMLNTPFSTLHSPLFAHYITLYPRLMLFNWCKAALHLLVSTRSGIVTTLSNIVSRKLLCKVKPVQCVCELLMSHFQSITSSFIFEHDSACRISHLISRSFPGIFSRQDSHTVTVWTRLHTTHKRTTISHLARLNYKCNVQKLITFQHGFHRVVPLYRLCSQFAICNLSCISRVNSIIMNWLVNNFFSCTMQC